jgi:hypothetical protein
MASPAQHYVQATPDPKQIHIAHEAYMKNEHNLPVRPLRIPRKGFFPGLQIRVRVVDFMDHHKTHNLVLWLRGLGIETIFSNEKIQLGWSCGCIAPRVVHLLRTANRHRQNFMQVDVREAASLEITRAQYQWLEQRGAAGHIPYSNATYPHSTVPRLTTTDQGLKTPFLTGDEVSYLVKLQHHGDRFLRRTNGRFHHRFVSPGAGDPGVCSIFSFYQAQERIGRILRQAQSAPAGSREFETMISNTESEGSGEHWITIAIEINTQQTTCTPQKTEPKRLSKKRTRNENDDTRT